MDKEYEVLTEEEIKILLNSIKEKSIVWKAISKFILSKDNAARLKIKHNHIVNDVKRKYPKLICFSKTIKGETYIYMIKEK